MTLVGLELNKYIEMAISGYGLDPLFDKIHIQIVQVEA
jgi:hypothetical protein